MVVLIVIAIAEPTGKFQYLVGNEVLAGAIALYNGTHHVLRYIGIVGQQLLGVFREAITAVTERRVVVVATDKRVESDTVDDVLGIQTLDFGIGVEFVEVAYTESQIGIGKELHGFGLCQSHDQQRNAFVEF